MGLHDHPWQEREIPEGLVASQYDALGTPSDPRIRDFASRWQLDDTALDKLTANFTCASDGKLKLDELITTRYRLDEVNRGYEDMMAGRNIRGVIIHEH